MLLSKPPAKKRTAAVITRNPEINTVLGGILSDWGLTLTERSQEAAVLFLERGLPIPDHQGRLVWLTPLPVADAHFLEIPISLTRLYHLLEEEFFPSPRRHIRVSVDCPADIRLDGAWLEARLTSLSDRGARLSCDRELPVKKGVTIETRLAGRVLRLSAEVLYCIPAGDVAGRERPQVGVLFKPLDQQMCEALRRYVEQACVTRVCERNGIAGSDPALSWIAVARNPWSGMS